MTNLERRPRLLVVDDAAETRELLDRHLSSQGYSVLTAVDVAQALGILGSTKIDLVITDLKLPGVSGLDLVRHVRDNLRETEIMMITGYPSIESAVAAVKSGAQEYLTKPFTKEELLVAVRRAIERINLRAADIGQKDIVPGFPMELVGESEALRKLVQTVTRAAASTTPVLITGEYGTGKALVARLIHRFGPRAQAPFVEVNCSNLRGDLLASELFGHARGAFTTAVQDKQGLIEVADGGTLFLDEISDMDIGVQAQFLKVIEEKQYRRVGEVKVRRSEFRLICATNRDLLEETHHGRFRKDLYFRINVLPIVIPSLRERQEDLPGLVLHLLRNLGAPNVKISSEAMQLLKAYPWPGNIRELRNVLERGLLLSYGQSLTLEHFSSLESQSVFMSHDKDMNNLENIEEAHIREAVRRFSGDTRKAAESLGISRATLYRKLKKFQQTPK